MSKKLTEIRIGTKLAVSRHLQRDINDLTCRLDTNRRSINTLIKEQRSLKEQRHVLSTLLSSLQGYPTKEEKKR